MQLQYTSVDRIFAKFSREVTSIFSEGDLIEMIGEALEFIHTPKAYEPFVAFVEVENHQCAIPKNAHQIVQIARNNRWQGSNCSDMCPLDITAQINCNDNDVDDTPTTSNITKSMSCPCISPSTDAVWLDVNNQPIVDYDLAYYRPYFNLRLESFASFSNTSYYKEAYTPVRATTSTMMSGLVCNLDNPNPYYNNDYFRGFGDCKSNIKDEYGIVAGSILRFSFKEGMVAIAYTKQLTDPVTGYPMIPDHISHITAITKYITLKKFEKDLYDGRQGAVSIVNKLEQDWNWYCAQASNAEKMPYGIDEHQNLLDQRQRLIPQMNAYYGFFGNLNTPEVRVWNNRYKSNRNLIYGGDGIAGLYSSL